MEDAPAYTGVVVRNTFLDIDDRAPEGLGLKRGQTAPPTVGGTGTVAQDSWQGGWESEEEEEEGEDPGPLHAAGPPPAEQIDGGDDAVPAEHAVNRVTTVDWYEQEEEWDWGPGNNTQHEESAPLELAKPEPERQPLAPAPALSGGAPCPMGQAVVVGGSAMPQPVYMQGMPGGPMPAMVQMVPMMIPVGSDGQPMMMPMEMRQPDRGARWPAGIEMAAASQTGPVAAPTAGHAGVESNFAGPLLGGGGMVTTDAPQPHTLTRAHSVNSNKYRIHWTVDARKLRGNDKQAVSPPFELFFGPSFPSVIFKMMLYPKVVSDSKGGASFKKARGHGFVQLKCEAELSEANIANVNWRVTIGNEPPRGPVDHNFALSAVSRLPKQQEEWDFNTAVDQESGTFVVCLEVQLVGKKESPLPKRTLDK